MSMYHNCYKSCKSTGPNMQIFSSDHIQLNMQISNNRTKQKYAIIKVEIKIKKSLCRKICN